MEQISVKINFDRLFKIMIVAMKLNRSHPDVARDRKWVYQFTIMHGLFFLIFSLLLYSIIFYDLKNNDFTQACANGILSVVFSVVTFKYSIMLWYQGLLKGLLEEMRVDYEMAEKFNLDEQNVVFNYAKRGKAVVDLWLAISICTASLFPVKAIVLMIYYTMSDQFQFVHLYELTYPSPIEEIKNQANIYFVLFLLFLFYDIYAMLMYIAFAPLGPVLMLHACGQLELVEKRLLTIYKNTNNNSALDCLKEIIKHLQKIYSFVERIKESFKLLYELTLKATAIILPITFYQVIESFHKGDIRIEFIAIIIGGISLSSIPCYYSTKLLDKGEELRLAMYMCGWEANLAQRGVRSALLVAQSRASRPVAIRTMFRTVSLDALSDLYHQSYALFNLLNAAWN